MQAAPRRAIRESIFPSSPTRPAIPKPPSLTRLGQNLVEAIEAQVAAESAFRENLIELDCPVVTVNNPTTDEDMRLALVGGQVTILDDPEDVEILYGERSGGLRIPDGVMLAGQTPDDQFPSDEEILEAARYHAGRAAVLGESMIETPDPSWPSTEVGAGVPNAEPEAAESSPAG